MEQSDFKGDSLPIFKDDPIDFKRTGIRFGNSGQFYMLMNGSVKKFVSLVKNGSFLVRIKI